MHTPLNARHDVTQRTPFDDVCEAEEHHEGGAYASDDALRLGRLFDFLTADFACAKPRNWRSKMRSLVGKPPASTLEESESAFQRIAMRVIAIV